MSLPDYYAHLEVAVTATPGEIKRSYRRLARRFHPDLNPEALDRHIKQLNEAYKILGNPTNRAAYDEQLRLAQEERQRQQQRQRQALAAKREPKLTWVQGIFGFVRELKKGMRD